MGLCCSSQDFIEIAGLCNPDDICLDTCNFWTEISVPEVLCIPEQKPDIEQLNIDNITAKIIRKKVIVAPGPTGSTPEYYTNVENRRTTGRKLIIEGVLLNVVTYTANVPDQAVHSAEFSIPFSAFIVLDRSIVLNCNGTTVTKDPLDLDFNIKTCIEDVYIESICERKVFKNITLLLQAIPVIPDKCADDCNFEEDCSFDSGFRNSSACGCSENKEIVCQECLEDPLLKITGVCDEDKIKALVTKNGELWTEMYIPEILCIPEQKPDIEQLLSISSKACIISQKVIRTPDPITRPTNQEGLLLTGKKLIIEGILKQKIIYVADVPEQSVHAAHFDVPFSAFIIVNSDTCLTTTFDIKLCIEDIFACINNPRQIFKNITLFIKAEPKECKCTFKGLEPNDEIALSDNISQAI